MENRARTRFFAHAAALVVVAAAATFLLIGDFAVRMANASSDDGIVGYAHFLKYPERFRVDAAFTNYAPAALTSMMNWFPGLLFKYLDVDPDALNLLFVYAQNVLLALSIFYLAWTLVRRLDVAWLSALFVLGARPHWLNLAVYGDLDWMPYPGHFALPPLVFAFAFALRDRRLPALLFVLIGGLIHPLLGLFSAAIIFILWSIARWRDRNTRRWWSGTLGLAGMTLVFVAPAFVLSWRTPQIPVSRMLPTILSNGHMIPWANPDCSYCMPAFVASFIAIVAFTALAWYGLRLPGVVRAARDLLVACVAVSTACLLLHVAAYFLGIAGILKLLLHRSSILLLLCATPLAIAWVWSALQEGRWARVLVASRVLIAPSVAAAFAAMLALMPADPSANSRAAVRGRILASLRALGYALFALVVARELPRIQRAVESARITLGIPNDAIAPVFNLESSLFLLWILFLAGMGLLWLLAGRSDRLRRWSHGGLGEGRVSASPIVAVAVIAALIAGSFRVNAARGRAAIGGEARLFYDVQRWARTATDPSDAFIVANTSVYGGWRNYTRRPTVAPYPVGGVYFYPQSAMEYNQRLARFYADVLGLGLEDVSRRLIDEREFWEFYSRLDERGLRRFAETFGGKYLVRRSAWHALSFPIAYRNSGYVVYEIPHG